MPTPAASRLTGDLAETSIGANISITGTTTTASSSITALSSVVGLVVGQVVSGAGIPAGSTIVTIGAGTMTISNPAAASATVPIVAAAENQTFGLQEWTIDWKRKTVDSTTTDDGGAESALGSTVSFTGKAKFAYIDSDAPLSQGQILAVINQVQASAQKWNFFPTVSTGRSAFTGMAIIDGITITSGVGKLVGLDVSLKGTGFLTPTVQLAPVANAGTTTGLTAEV